MAFPKKMDQTHNSILRWSTGTVLGVLLLLPGVEICGQSGGTLAQGLTGWWTFDGSDVLWSSPTDATAVDRSGNGHTLTLHGFLQSTAEVAGQTGDALAFNGAIRLRTGNALSSFMSSAEGTISVWFYAKPGNTGLCSDGSLSTLVTDGPYDGGYIWLGYDGVNLCAGGFDGSIHSVYTPAPMGEWVHACWVHSGGWIYLYENGAQAGRVAVGNIADLTHAVFFGQSFAFSPFRGYVDDTRIYSRALSPDEVMQLYNGQTDGTVAQGLTGWWTFDSRDVIWTSSNTANCLDRSTNGFTAYLRAVSQSAATIPGKFGEGLSLSFGEANYLACSYALSNFISRSEGTISVWFYAKPGNTGLCRHDGLAGGNLSTFFSDFTEGRCYGPGWPFQGCNRGGSVWFGYDGTNLCVGAVGGSISAIVEAEQWIHAVWAYSARGDYLYTNGVQISGGVVLATLLT